MKYFVTAFGRRHEVEFARTPDGLFVQVDGKRLALDVQHSGDGNGFSFLLAGQSVDVALERRDGTLEVLLDGERHAVEVLDEREVAVATVARAGGPRVVKAPMAGVVVDIKVAAGQKVAKGATLVVVEAMKMQNGLLADADAAVKTVHVKVGQPVNLGQALVELE